MRFRRVAPLAMIAVVGWLAATGVAAAHDGLASSTPADGQSVDASPERVELEFTGDPQDLGDGTAVIVADADGKVVSTGDVEIDGSFVRRSLLPDLPDGTYAVSYRVISSDGHEVEGSTTFYVGPVPTAGAPFGFDEPADSDRTPAIILGVVGVVIVVVVAWLVLRRSRQLRGTP